jgi:hyperosmotically inducible protein
VQAFAAVERTHRGESGFRMFSRNVDGLPLRLELIRDAHSTDRSHPKAFVKDSVITKVKSKLAADHITSLAHIRVDTDKDGVVWLSGSARSKDAVERAVDLARNTDGVRDVHNSLVVRPDDR